MYIFFHSYYLTRIKFNLDSKRNLFSAFEAMWLWNQFLVCGLSVLINARRSYDFDKLSYDFLSFPLFSAVFFLYRWSSILEKNTNGHQIELAKKHFTGQKFEIGEIDGKCPAEVGEGFGSISAVRSVFMTRPICTAWRRTFLRRHSSLFHSLRGIRNVQLIFHGMPSIVYIYTAGSRRGFNRIV